MIKYLLLPLFFLSLCLTTSAQHLAPNAHNNQSEMKSALTPGAYISTGGNAQALTGFAACFSQGTVPTGAQNYVLERTFKVAGVNASNISSTRTMCEETQTIQYLDGLGRPVQTVGVRASPAGNDIVQSVAYDAFGREAVKYLPYVAAGNDGAFRADALSPTAGVSAFYGAPPTGVVQTVNPYAITVFEPSPLNRVLEQGAPGATWQPVQGSTTGHTVKATYGSNGVDEVKLWAVTATGASSNSYYAAGKLYKTTSMDENWTVGKAGTTEEFKDFDGRVVLKRVWETTTKSLSTYYVYDDFGSLRYMLPPAVNENGSSTSSFSEGDTAFNSFIYGYRYDGKKRLIEKKTPGKGWEYMVYNAINQLVLIQDAVQRGNGQWVFAKYDALGRMVMTGLYADAGSRAALQAVVDVELGAHSLWEQRPVNSGYTNDAFPRTVTSYLNINYYDSYDFPGAATYTYSGGSSKIKGLPTGTVTAVLGTSTTLMSVIYYDEEGRAVKTYSQHYLAGLANSANYDEVTNTYSFAGELTASTRAHHTTSATTTIATAYEYDHMGRKLSTSESINGQAQVALNRLQYNEVGQLLQKDLHSTDGTTFLQNTKFSYNERGWLRGSTSPEFSMQLKYDDGTVPQYNGNISNQLWGAGSSLPNTFSYGYDKLNRLTDGASTGIAMSETLTYDVMGNIASLRRDGGTAGTYNYSGNQLTSISGGALATGSYAYDANGNATTDGRTGMALAYNLLGLPATAAKTGAVPVNLTYTYDGMGRKLRKANSTSSTTTDYVSGIHYINGVIDFIQTEEGIARNNGGTYSYEYNLTDHLGNVRATFKQSPLAPYALEVLQRTDYYAFGMRRMGLPNADVNRYLYNGKELQDELGSYDYGARFYDPVIGRWNAPDMLAELAPELSPFRYCYNNPVNYTDPFGLFESRKEARKYRRENKISGQIKKDADGNYSIYDDENSMTYSAGDDSKFGGDLHPNDGVVESASITQSSEYGAKDGYDAFGTGFSYFENITWGGLSTATKSKIAYDALKYVKNLTSYKLPVRPSGIYGGISKALPKIGLVMGIASGGMIVGKVLYNKEIKASDVLDIVVTGVSFIPGGGWIVGGIYLGADLLTKYVSGKSIGQHLDDYVEEEYDKDGGTLASWK